MITTGMVRKIDDLGRVIIPRDIRRKLFGNNGEGQPIEFFIGEDNTVILKAARQETYKWEPIVNAHGELVEFICECGCSSQAASAYCPDCGVRMDNSDIEERIKIAAREAL